MTHNVVDYAKTKYIISCLYTYYPFFPSFSKVVIGKTIDIYNVYIIQYYNEKIKKNKGLILYL